VKLIIGLGNPGEKYTNTRHNLGYMVLDELLRKLTSVEETIWQEDKKLNSLIAKIDGFVLVKPQAFMNRSGLVVVKVANFYKIEVEDIWVVHDDVDLLLGKMKIRIGGAAAGHHGVESIIERLGTDQFVRFRLGIGHPREEVDFKRKPVEDYVLADFDTGEKTKVKQLVKKAVKAIHLTLDEGLEKTMNRFNA